MTLLTVENLTKHFGGVTALNYVDIQVNHGEIVAIIGPNGAGKTTLFNLITGLDKPDSGKILYKEMEIGGLPPETIAGQGITRTFQNLQLFHKMTVAENVMVGAHRHGTKGLLQAGLRWPGTKEEEKKICLKAMEQLEYVQLTARKDDPVEILSYGEQRLVEIARAMAMEPELILLDEPAAGLNQGETDQLGDLICKLPQMGMTVMIVEHNMDLVMSVAHRIVVFNYGSKLAEGDPQQIQNNEKVIAAYLGEEVL